MESKNLIIPLTSPDFPRAAIFRTGMCILKFELTQATYPRVALLCTGFHVFDMRLIKTQYKPCKHLLRPTNIVTNYARKEFVVS